MKRVAMPKDAEFERMAERTIFDWQYIEDRYDMIRYISEALRQAHKDGFNAAVEKCAKMAYKWKYIDVDLTQDVDTAIRSLKEK